MSAETFLLAGKRPLTRAQSRAITREIKRQLGRGYSLIEAQIPGNATRWWISGPNLGDPFDRDASRTAAAIVDAAGVVRS